MTMHAVTDTAVLLRRSLRHIVRSPDTIITTLVMPIAMMLLFVHVLGGAIETGAESYVGYLLPGILVITIASGVSYTAFRLFLDMQGGLLERFRSMPIARSSGVGPASIAVRAARSTPLVLGTTRCTGTSTMSRRPSSMEYQTVTVIEPSSASGVNGIRP